MASKTEGTKILNHCERCKYFHTELIDTLTEYLEDDEPQGVENGETV